MEIVNVDRQSRSNPIIFAIYQSLIIWESPLSSALLTGIIFTGISSIVGSPFRLTDLSYFNFLADAFLHGQVHLRVLPPTTHDLSLYQGQYTLYWGPLPAILLMPIIAIFGINVSDSLQTLVLGAINCDLFALMIRQADLRGVITLDPLRRGLLVLFFSLGTTSAPLLSLGTVWHVSQLVSVSFALLAYVAAFSFEHKKAFLGTGCAIACVLATRISVVFVGIFLAWYLLNRYQSISYRRLINYVFIGVAPITVVLLLLLLYNHARFGIPFENGLSYHLMAEVFKSNFQKYGVLNIHYVPANFYYDFVFYPFISIQPLFVAAIGGSLFLLSPLYFASLYTLWRDRQKASTWFLFLSVLVGVIPSLLIMSPGTISFGPRYLLDILPPLLLLTASGIRRWSIPVIGLLTTISVLHYLIGSIMMVYSWYANL